MRCPECNTLNEPNAAACTSCGLLLILKAAATETAPKRRAEDMANQRRRSADREQIKCKFCGGEIAANAIRCRHCSEIVNDEYYRERAHRMRSRINYASWVAYIFGLAALLVLRPVGIFSIAAGLLLSIAYYAIPVEPPASAGDKKKRGIFSMIRSSLRFERVAIPIPNMRNKKLVFVGTPLVAALVGYSANLFLLQEPMNQVLKQNSAFSGMEVSAHYKYWIVPGVVVYDLDSIAVDQTPIDVHTAFLEFAKKLKDKRYSKVELSFKGHTKFSIDGASFRRLGDEYAKKNFDFVLYKLPHLLHAEDGAKVPDKTASDRDALLQFHRQWYGNDTMTRTVKSGMVSSSQ